MQRLGKEGNLSIIFVITIFIFLIVSMFFIEVIIVTMSKNEVQGVMDNAGVIALRYVIEEKDWRDEEIIIDKTAAKAKFLDLVYSQIDTSSVIDEFRVTELNVYAPGDSGTGHLKSQGKDQYFLEAVANVRYNSIAPVVDLNSGATQGFFNFFSRQSETRGFGGVEQDGKGEVVIRTVSRLVLRGVK